MPRANTYQGYQGNRALPRPTHTFSLFSWHYLANPARACAHDVALALQKNQESREQLLPLSWSITRAWLIEDRGPLRYNIMPRFEPLGLAVSVHNGLPFLSDLGNAYRLQPNATLAGAIHEGFGEAIDYFLVR